VTSFLTCLRVSMVPTKSTLVEFPSSSAVHVAPQNHQARSIPPRTIPTSTLLPLLRNDGLVPPLTFVDLFPVLSP
jgi:hypothetical protein